MATRPLFSLAKDLVRAERQREIHLPSLIEFDALSDDDKRLVQSTCQQLLALDDVALGKTPLAVDGPTAIIDGEVEPWHHGAAPSITRAKPERSIGCFWVALALIVAALIGGTGDYWLEEHRADMARIEEAK
jgi:hypothetical protein